MTWSTCGGAVRRAALALCACAVLLAGCGGSPSRPRVSAAAGVLVATATQWSSANSGPTYLTITAPAPETGGVRWRHREERFAYHG
jgi:hypothetical protein